MLSYSAQSKAELQNEFQNAMAHLEACKAKKLNLNLARGKPSKEQLDAVSDILQTITDVEECIVDGVDV